MEHVIYRDKNGKEWTCTVAEWKMIQEREARFKKKMFTYVGPFAPSKVGYRDPVEKKEVKQPSEITVIKSKTGPDAGQQEASN